VKTYSGGMRRRLDLAATLVAEPQILFLDEPTTGLDPRSRFGLWDVISKLTKDCHTVFFDHTIPGRSRSPGRQNRDYGKRKNYPRRDTGGVEGMLRWRNTCKT